MIFCKFNFLFPSTWQIWISNFLTKHVFIRIEVFFHLPDRKIWRILIPRLYGSKKNIWIVSVERFFPDCILRLYRYHNSLATWWINLSEDMVQQLFFSKTLLLQVRWIWIRTTFSVYVQDFFLAYGAGVVFNIKNKIVPAQMLRSAHWGSYHTS